MANIDVELYTQKSEINTNPPEIVIEITGLKSLNKFIGLDDTPTYYENGKFFKVLDSKIVYTDITWEDIKGDIDKNPELQQEVLRLVEENAKKYTEEAVNNAVDTHNKNENAHPYIQNIIEENFENLTNKIELNKIDTNQKIDEANSKIDTNTSNIDRLDTFTQEINTNLENLTLEVNVDIKSDISKLQDDLQTTNQEVSDNFTILDIKIDNTKSELTNTISDNYTTLDNKINENYNNLDLRVTTNTQDIADLTQVVEDDFQEVNTHITDLNTRVTNNTNNITSNTQLINETIENLKQYSKTSDFANVAFTGEYNDLLNIPDNIATNEYVNTQINNALKTITEFDFIIVDVLPQKGESNHIYLVPVQQSEGNIYSEYLWIESTNSYELIGSTETDLSGYYTSIQVDNLLSNKVDKENGKSLILDTEIERLSKIKQLTAGTNIEITEENVINNTQTSAEWGNIQGNILDQSDLISEFDKKQDTLSAGSAIEIEDNTVGVAVFDLSKLTVVGSPTITSDGVASGFSVSDYIKNSLSITSSKIKIKGSFTFGENLTSYQVAFELYSESINGHFISLRPVSDNILAIVFYNGSASEVIRYSQTEVERVAYKPYDFEIEIDGTIAKSTINGITKTINNVVFADITELYIGKPFYGSIDLKQFSITVDGEQVFSGSKTLYAALDEKQNRGNYISYVSNTVTVAEATRSLAKITPEALYVPEALVMGGSALSAGLVTRGICGSTQPTTNGTANKENLYLNYDGNNTNNPNGRGVVINAGSSGTDLGNGMYSYCATRGDVVKAWVEANAIASKATGITASLVSDGDFGTIKIVGPYATYYLSRILFMKNSSGVDVEATTSPNGRVDLPNIFTSLGAAKQSDLDTLSANKQDNLDIIAIEGADW